MIRRGKNLTTTFRLSFYRVDILNVNISLAVIEWSVLETNIDL